VELAAPFQPRDESDWKALAEKALEGRPLESLAARTPEELALRPLYWAREEAANRAMGAPGALPFARGFRAVPAMPPWEICQLHETADPAETNRQILADLEGGASAVALRLAAPEQTGLAMRSPKDLARALEGVHLDFIALYLEPGIRFAEAASALRALWAERGLKGDRVKGGFGADPLGACAKAGGLDQPFAEALAAAAAIARETGDTHPNVTALCVDTRPYHSGGAGEAQELACLAATLAAYLRALEEAGLPPEQGLARIGFTLACDADLFLSIAKLRAARLVIGRIAQACGAAAAVPGLHLRAETSSAMMSRLDPHVNLLRTTAAAAAAALGGADSVTVLPFTWALGETGPFARRAARNIQLILQEEAHLGRVLDTAGGSWYADTLTSELGERAWELFQGIEAQGGMAAALASGRVQAMLAETAGEGARQTASGEAELIGVNAFPHLYGTVPETRSRAAPAPLEDPAITVEPVPLRRPAAPFERLRSAARAFAEREGARPRVFLANLGTLAGYNARANFARNLFAAGGIEAVGEEGFESAAAAAEAFKASGAEIACICGGGETYARMAGETARALAGAGATRVYLAGRPGDGRAALRRAGVSGFIHKGADMIAILEEALGALGVDLL